MNRCPRCAKPIHWMTTSEDHRRMHEEQDRRADAAHKARTFWCCACLTCHATFGGWDLDPERLSVELAVPCPYDGGRRVAHVEATFP